MLNRIRELFGRYYQQRNALRLATERFEATKQTIADPAGSYVYMRAGDVYFVKVSGLWTSQWYCVKADGTSVDEVALPTSTTT